MGKVIIPDNDAVAVVDKEEMNWNGKDEEEEAAKEDALNDDNRKNRNVVHEAEANAILDAQVVAKVAFAEMVTKPTVNAVIVGTEEFVDDKPNSIADNDNDNNDDSNREGVPVAKVVNKDKVVITARENPKVVEDNNEMSTWESTVRDLPINFVLMSTFCGTFTCACRYPRPGARTQRK